jgi:hypothetical protein
MKKKIIAGLLLYVFSLMALEVLWTRLYPEIDTPVYDTSGSRGLYEDMYLALSGDVNGLAHYNSVPDSLIGIYEIMMPGIVSAQVNESNTDEVFCAVGNGSYSDGLYKFSLDSMNYELIEYAINPNFVKKLTNGYYFGHSSGLMFSEDGEIWTDVEYFNGKSVTCADEDYAFNIILSSGSELFIDNGDSYSSFDTGLTVRDIGKMFFVDKKGTLMASISDGSYSDGIYLISYGSGSIEGVSTFEYVFNSNKMCNYGPWFAVTLVGSDQISLLGDDNGIDTSPVSGNFNEIYFIEPDFSGYWSFIIGTDKGVYKGLYPMGIEDNSIPQTTELHQNYPNPFNPETSIKYSLSNDAQVKLTVYDIAGREVARLVSEKQARGNYDIKFNGGNMTSGLYFYRLDVDGKTVQSRKMMLLK